MGYRRNRRGFGGEGAALSQPLGASAVHQLHLLASAVVAPVTGWDRWLGIANPVYLNILTFGAVFGWIAAVVGLLCSGGLGGILRAGRHVISREQSEDPA